MKKLLIMIPLICLISGCFYVERQGCLQRLHIMGCIRNFSDFDAYTKEGDTKRQKTQDITDCGGTISRYGNIFNGLVERALINMENETAYNQNEVKKIAVEHFDQCMKNKGYIFQEVWPKED